MEKDEIGGLHMKMTYVEPKEYFTESMRKILEAGEADSTKEVKEDPLQKWTKEWEEFAKNNPPDKKQS